MLGMVKGRVCLKKEWGRILISVAAAVGADILVAYFFFNSIWGIIPGALIGVMTYRKIAGSWKEKERIKLLSDFGTLIETVAAALSSGMSLENAFIGAGKDLSSVYGKNEVIMKELTVIEKKLRMGLSLHGALYEFADKYDQEEIRDFAGVILSVRKTGGNVIKIIKKTSETITSRIELIEEMNVMVASKRLEQRIMTCMPFMIVVYLRISNPKYMLPLYGNIGGVIVMCAALAGVFLADYIGGKVTDWNVI